MNNSLDSKYTTYNTLLTSKNNRRMDIDISSKKLI